MRSLILVLALGVSACAKKETPVAGAGQRKPGWTNEYYDKSVATCQASIAGALDDGNKATPICRCWFDDMALRYTPQQLNTTDPAIEQQIQTSLSQCATNSGETLQFS